MTYVYNETDVYVYIGNYVHPSNTMIRLLEKTKEGAVGDVFATATINVDGMVLEEDGVIIKDFSENEGMYQWLLDNGIILEPELHMQVGYNVLCPVCRIRNFEGRGKYYGAQPVESA